VSLQYYDDAPWFQLIGSGHTAPWDALELMPSRVHLDKVPIIKINIKWDMLGNYQLFGTSISLVDASVLLMISSEGTNLMSQTYDPAKAEQSYKHGDIPIDRKCQLLTRDIKEWMTNFQRKK